MVDKPAGMSSHDVVARVRSAVGGGKVGHAGTLDPFATGVLVLCLGAATRLAEWATRADKRYRAELVLGVETTTYDPTGEVTAIRPVTVERSAVEMALNQLIGEIDQRPPTFSAIQMGGRRLYDLARRGEPVEVEPRRVTIHRIELIEWSPPRVTIDLICSKGTYVRSLAHDLGAGLGTGAHLGALRRLASGDFAIEGAVELERAVTAIRAGQGVELVRPLESAVEWMQRVEADADAVIRLRHGQPITLEPVPSSLHPREESLSPSPPPPPEVGHGDGSIPDHGEGVGRAHGPDGRLVAILHRREGAWWPLKVLPE